MNLRLTIAVLPARRTLPPEARCPGSREAFTLMEVMIALGIFFVAVFAILGVVSNGLRNARALRPKDVDGDVIFAQLSLTNSHPEGEDSGDFGEMYPDYRWTRETRYVGTNGLAQVDLVVLRRSGDHVVSTMSALFFDKDKPKR